jgi:hypothetical protein
LIKARGTRHSAGKLVAAANAAESLISTPTLKTSTVDPTMLMVSVILIGNEPDYEKNDTGEAVCVERLK